MARPIRIEVEGGLYHVTSRGNARQDIYFDREDYQIFLQVLSDVVDRYGWIIHAYCLMTNHYHLLVETPQANLSAGMRQLNGVFTQKINLRYQRSGHLFQGRYKAFLVEKESYLLELSRYIVLNPVRAGLVSSPDKWPWSSLMATAGYEMKPGFLHTDWLLGLFDSSKPEAAKQYIHFVEEGLTCESPLKKAKGGFILGREGFVRKAGDLIDKPETEETIKRERYAARPSLEVKGRRRLYRVTLFAGKQDSLRKEIEWGQVLRFAFLP
ncbi:MAG: transposase [Deltaproteobacteria bacterium]|nr:transposase [Deltaproteobacteria bacterium]